MSGNTPLFDTDLVFDTVIFGGTDNGLFETELTFDPLIFDNTVTISAGSVVKVWSGAAWIDGNVKRWDGAAWVDTIVKRWSGVDWVNI